MDRKTGKLIDNYIGAIQLKWYKMSRVKKEREKKERRTNVLQKRFFSSFFLVTQTSVNSTFFPAVI